MRWAPFNFKGTQYDLDHLRPRTVTYVKEAKGDKPAVAYTVDITFSLHCFTRECKNGETADAECFYTDERETRLFDFYRWGLSHNLPGIIGSLMQRKCFHAGYGNFLTIDLVNQHDKTVVKYEVFFQVSRASRKATLNLFVQSAYVRDKRDAGGKPRHNPPIRFAFILHNKLGNIAIKMPQ